MSEAVIESVADAVAAAANRLRAAGIDAPRREAERLWAALRGPARGPAFLARDTPLAEDARTAYLGAVERRLAGEPLAYIAGWCGFRMLDLKVDRRALIPRPETEGLVELLLSRVSTGVAVDVGTGTGCIALSLLDEAGFDHVIAIDRSAEALALARENAAMTGKAPRFVRGDLTSALAADACDALVSNPPYLTDAELAELDRGVRDWEPALALASGPDGMRATDALLVDGLRVVRPGGWIALELDATRARRAAAHAATAGWNDIVLAHDLFGRERYLLARRSDA